MITGDHPQTALSIARQAGLAGSDAYLTGADLDALDEAALAARLAGTQVFCRVQPEQKLRLVRALKANGEVVGMTGDGVNDAPALRAADIGIAMGKRGTDVARESAGLVITDDDFTSIAGGVRQGRGIFDNLRKAMAYIVAVHMPIIGMSLVPLFATDWPLVMLPVQIALIELIIDPACSVVFEAEQVDPAIMDQPPRRLGEPVIGRRVVVIAVLQGLSVLAAVLGVYLWSVLGDRPDAVTRSVTFATLVMGNLLLILVNRSWRLPVWRTFRERRNATVKWILLGGLGVLTVMLAVPPVSDAFKFGRLAPLDWVIVPAAAFLGVAWFEVWKAVTHRAGPDSGSGPGGAA
jgi:Ca2+-transporting ATPase